MFKRSNTGSQVDLLGGVPTLLEGRAQTIYTDPDHWHNQFRTQFYERIDESLFAVLYDQHMGAPNAPVALLASMIVLKEAFGWSDQQLFEAFRFNTLVRAAVGLFNLQDSVPTESTYYLFRQRLTQWEAEQGEDLWTRMFRQVTGGQARAFEVDGEQIRMDSKLIAANLARCSRYELVHGVVKNFYESLDAAQRNRLPAADRQTLEALSETEARKTVWRSTSEQVGQALEELGELMQRLLEQDEAEAGPEYELLERVFAEQFTPAGAAQPVQVRPGRQVAADSVQSPHETECDYRRKRDQQVQGYSFNLTETAGEGPLQLITDLQTAPASQADPKFVAPALAGTRQVTGQPVGQVWLDGAFQSPDNDSVCQGVDMVYTGLPGRPPRYEPERTDQGVWVRDTQTGITHRARKAHARAPSREQRWWIQTDAGRRYFGEQALRAGALRRELAARPPGELHRRNNVESSLHHLAYPLRGGKTRYRGRYKHQIWAVARALWINVGRITRYGEPTAPISASGQAQPAAFLKKWIFFSVCHQRASGIASARDFSLNGAFFLTLLVLVNDTFRRGLIT